MSLPESPVPEAFKAFELRGWQAAAETYHSEFGRLTSQMAAPLLDAAEVKRDTRLLDVACGPGYVSGMAGARGARVTGCDLSPEMVELASRSYPTLAFRVGDAEALGFPDRIFAAVTMSFLLGHLARPGVALREAHRVLAPGGKLALCWWQMFDKAVAFGVIMDSIRARGRMDVPLPEAPAFDAFSRPEMLRGALAEVGFRSVTVVEHPLTWRIKSADELFEAYYEGSVRTGALLRAQSPEALGAIRAEVAKRSQPWMRGGELIFPMPAFVASGRKE